MDAKDILRTQWDRLLGWALVAVGAIALVVGWVRVADTPYPAEQLPLLLSGGIGGGLLVVFGAALLLSADARDEWAKLDRIERLLRGEDPDRAPEPEGADDATGPEAKAG